MASNGPRNGQPQVRVAEAVERMADVAETAAEKDPARFFSERITLYLKEFPSALVLAVMTAIVTLLLAMVLSAIMGGASRKANAEIIDHSILARCQFAEVIEILKEIGEQSDSIDLSQYPQVNTSGIDCTGTLNEPFVPGEN